MTKSEYQVKWYKENAKKRGWYLSYKCAMKRCKNKKHKSYKNYGAKGIECLMKPNDFKALWFRDEAFNMTKPTISREDHTQSYTADNCRYQEFDEHMAEDVKHKWG